MDTKESLLSLSSSQLRKAADIKERIEVLNNELSHLLGGEISVNGVGNGRRSGKRTMSAEGRRRIGEAAKARWAKIRAAKGQATSAATASGGAPKKRTMSPAARRKIAAAQRARWAKVKTGNTNPKPAKDKRTMSTEARKKISEASKARWAKRKAGKK